VIDFSDKSQSELKPNFKIWEISKTLSALRMELQQERAAIKYPLT
jgi:hypothetical protein